MRMPGIFRSLTGLTVICAMPFLSGCSGEADAPAEPEGSSALETTQTAAETAEETALQEARQDVSQKEPALVAAAISDRDPAVRFGKIGRASCRERV